MNIYICPVKQLYRLIESGSLKSNSAAILSSSYPVQREKLSRIRYVSCQYDDIDREVPGRSFPYAQGAEAFARFLKNLGNTGDLYCCCDGGCRRSAAVACSAMLYFGLDDMVIWQNPAYEPNPFVFRSMCEALELSISDEELDFRIETNRHAFKKAIQR